MVKALDPVKCCAITLCKKDLNLLTADVAMNAVIDELKCQEGEIPSMLAASLEKRYIQRRNTHVLNLIIFLRGEGVYQSPYNPLPQSK